MGKAHRQFIRNRTQHTVLGSLEAYLHSNPPDYRFQVESLLELLYYAFTEYNITESPEFKAKIGPLDRKLRDLAETDEYTHNSEYPQKLRAASRQPWLSILSNPVR